MFLNLASGCLLLLREVSKGLWTVGLKQINEFELFHVNTDVPMVLEYRAQIFIKNEKLSFKRISSLFSFMLDNFTSPHSNVLPSSEAIEKSLLFDQSIVLSIMNPVIQ